MRNFAEKHEYLTQYLTRYTHAGRPEKFIKLTLDCAINFAKKSKTDKSSLVYDFMVFCKENFEEIQSNRLNEQKNLIKSELEEIKSCVISNDKFPVYFDNIVNWIGYSRKDNAKRILTENFVKNNDFEVFLNIEENPNSLGGRPSECIKLTVDCAKSFAMLAQTEKGKQVRNYFLECEKELTEILKNKKSQSSQDVATQRQISTLQFRFEHSFDNLSKTINQNYFEIMQKNETIVFDLWDKNLEIQKQILKRLEFLEKERKALRKIRKSELQHTSQPTPPNNDLIIEKINNFQIIFTTELFKLKNENNNLKNRILFFRKTKYSKN